MKFALLLTLLVATAADDSQGGEEYSSESYAHEYEPAVPKCCVSFCPDHAPFFNKQTCSCVPGLISEEYYEAPTYGEAQSYESGEEQKSGDRQLQSFTSGPEGTVDTRNLRTQRAGTIVLWVAFAILFIFACYFLRMFWYYYTVAELGDSVGVLPDGLSSSIYFHLANPSLTAGFVCLIASLAYLTMASGNGWYIRCDGRQFFYARYIDWIITTPLLLHAIAHFSNSPNEIWSFLFFSDIVMIASGLIASTITGGEKWIYFGFAVLAFIPVMYYLCVLRDQVVDNRQFDPQTGLISAGTDGIFLPYIWFFHQFRVIVDLTVLAWFLYPIVWICAEGTDRLSVTGEVITYAVLDLISKGVFGWFVVTSEVRDWKLGNWRVIDPA